LSKLLTLSVSEKNIYGIIASTDMTVLEMLAVSWLV